MSAMADIQEAALGWPILIGYNLFPCFGAVHREAEQKCRTAAFAPNGRCRSRSTPLGHVESHAWGDTSNNTGRATRNGPLRRIRRRQKAGGRGHDLFI